MEGEGMQCSRHRPRGRRNPAGAICAECLQEKLGRLVAGGGAARPYSSQSPPSPPCCSSIRPTVVEASTAGYRGDLYSSVGSSAEKASAGRIKSAIIPFFLIRPSGKMKKKEKEKERESVEMSDISKKKKKRSFWSLIRSSAISDEKGRSTEESPESESQSSLSSFGRRVARSRSVGCGSRSFSGDVLGRISSGFGDCALRRAESQRENERKLTIRTRDDGLMPTDERLTPRMRRNWALRALASPIRAFRASSRLTTLTLASEDTNAAALGADSGRHVA